MKPEVSIIIPAYNRFSGLVESVETVLDQRFDNWELIVVDDSDQDIAEKNNLFLEFVSEKLNCETKYVEGDDNGLGAARQKGIEKAAGEFIAWLDDDDLWCEGKIEKQIQQLEENPEIDVSYGGKILHGSGWKETHKIIPDYEGNDKQEILRYNRIGAISAVMMRREVAEEVGFDTNISFAEDWDFHIRAVRKGFKYSPIKEPLIEYFGEENMDYTTSSDPQRVYQGLEAIREKNSDILSSNNSVAADFYSNFAKKMWKLGEYDKAIQASSRIPKSTMLQPYNSAIYFGPRLDKYFPANLFKLFYRIYQLR